jgi:hypothetical protein
MRRNATLLLAAGMLLASGCDEPEAEGECTLVTDCCQVCVEGSACGDGCLGEGESCHELAGCACDVSALCRGGGVGGGSLEYATCVGPRGTCSEDCCLERNEHAVVHEALVSCSVRSAGGGDLRLSFSALDPEEENGLEGTEMVFSADPVAFSPVRGCDEILVREALNEYPGDGCTELDVRADEPGGGGCLVELRLNEADVVDGRFTCEELQLPSQELYLSTVEDGEVAAGTFSLYGCSVSR